MCTITFFWKVWPSLPLVIAANRDEFYDRPSTPPQPFTTPKGFGALAGRDHRHGGSWMGVNSKGLFVGLTNRRGGEHFGGSRGEVVLNALDCESPQEAEDALQEAAKEGDFRFFNLLFGNIHDLRVASLHAPNRLTVVQLNPGLHILPSGLADLNDIRWPKVRRAHALLNPLTRAHQDPALAPQTLLGALWPTLTQTLADDRLPTFADLPQMQLSPRDCLFEAALQSIFIKTPLYGTRSSTIAAFQPSGALACYAFTDQIPTHKDAWLRLEHPLSSC